VDPLKWNAGSNLVDRVRLRCVLSTVTAVGNFVSVQGLAGWGLRCRSAA
jgi:hypothetical protein